MEPATLPLLAEEAYRFMLDGKVLGEGDFAQGRDLSAMGNFKSRPEHRPQRRLSN